MCICLQNIAGRRLEEIDIDDLPMEDNAEEEDEVDLDEYSFSKFASMYFQGAATPTYICQRLRQPLLHHEDKDDVLVLLLSLLPSFARPPRPEDRPCLTVLLSSPAGLAERVVGHPQVHGRPSRAQDARGSEAPGGIQTPGSHPPPPKPKAGTLVFLFQSAEL